MTPENHSYCLVMVTVGSEAEGETIAQTLLTEKLAACISITPIASFYTWQGEMNQDKEWQLVIKTRFKLFEKLEDRIKNLHSYEVPEIIAIPILAGSSAYLNWVTDNTQPG